MSSSHISNNLLRENHHLLPQYEDGYQKINHLCALLINGKSDLELVGVPVMKEFKIGWFEGTNTSFSPEDDLYYIVYTDGDIEDHDYNDLKSFVDTYK